MRRALLLAMVLLTVCGSTLGAPKKAKKKDDWLPPNKIRETIKKAAEEDFSLVILCQGKNSTCPLHNAKVAMFEKNGVVRRMAKARAYAGRAPREVMMLRGHIPYKRFIPYLMFTDGQGHLIGYVPNEGNQRDISAQAGQAKAVMTWKKKSRAKLDEVDKMITETNYAQAKSQLDEVETQDKERTGKIKWSIAKMCEKTPRPKEDGSDGAAQGVAAPEHEGVGKVGKKDADKSEEPKKLPKKPLPAEQAELLAGRIDACRQTLQIAINDDLTKAQILYAQGRPKAAMEALKPLLALEDDKELQEKAQELKADLDTALKEAGVEPQPAEQPAAGADPGP